MNDRKHEATRDSDLSRSIVLQLHYTYWYVEPEHRDIFSRYYLLKWDSVYFQHKLEGEEGMVEREGVTYQVIYHNCNKDAILHGLNTKIGGNQLLLSFRQLQESYDSQPIVLVTVA